MVVEALSYAFMQKAAIAGVAVAVACSFAGSFLVLRRYSLFGDAISHVAFGGVAVGLFFGTFPIFTAFAAAVLGALGLERLRSGAGVAGDSATAIVLVGGLAVGVVLVSAADGFNVDLFGFLFGSILLLDDFNAAFIAMTSAGAAATLFFLRKPLLHAAFSEEQARVSGMRVAALNYAFVAIAAVTVATSMRLVGILLVSALIVIPNVAAMMLGRGFGGTVAAAMAISAASAFSGILLSYYAGIAPSGAVVMAAIASLLGAAAFRRIRAARSARSSAA